MTTISEVIAWDKATSGRAAELTDADVRAIAHGDAAVTKAVTDLKEHATPPTVRKGVSDITEEEFLKRAGHKPVTIKMFFSTFTPILKQMKEAIVRRINGEARRIDELESELAAVKQWQAAMKA